MQATATFFLLHAIDALPAALLALLDGRDVRDVWESNNDGREMFLFLCKSFKLINSINCFIQIMLFVKYDIKSSIELFLLEELCK
jgi:hypothetical protein